MTKFNRTERIVPARFQTVGTVVEGPVLTIEEVPVPEFTNGRVSGSKVGADGKIITQLDVTLDVDGVPTLIHTRGGIANAIADAGGDLNVGDYLALTFTDTEDMGPELDPAKVFTASIVPAAKVKK